MSFDLKDLGQAIKTKRKSKESRLKPGKPMSQAELSRLARIPAPCLSNIENGKYRNPTWNILSKIAHALDCDISDFFSLTEKRNSPSHIALEEIIDMVIKERLENILEERTAEKKIVKK
ncbi:MAG: helix-turn-helix transcriptional regulator [Candidatus Aminicenantales bacterium]